MRVSVRTGECWVSATGNEISRKSRTLRIEPAINTIGADRSSASAVFTKLFLIAMLFSPGSCPDVVPRSEIDA